MEVASLEVGEGQEGEGGEEGAQLVGRLDTPGHRSDVRTVAFSSDNTALLTASAESLKVRQIGVPYLLLNTSAHENPDWIQEDINILFLQFWSSKPWSRIRFRIRIHLKCWIGIHCSGCKLTGKYGTYICTVHIHMDGNL